MFTRMSLVLVLLVGAGLEVSGAEAGKDERANAPRRHFTIGKETTHIVGPLDKQGFVDYAAALNERLSKGVTARNNANVLLWRASGPRAGGFRSMPPAFFQQLGMEAPPERAGPTLHRPPIFFSVG